MTDKKVTIVDAIRHRVDETNLNIRHQAWESYIDCLAGTVRVPLDSAGTRKFGNEARASSSGGIVELMYVEGETHSRISHKQTWSSS